MRGRGFVLLARVTRADKILHHVTITREVEVLAKADEGLLNAFMAGRVHQRHHLRPKVGVVRNEHPLAVE